jgi:antitoxin (DNA-binding transcriptional repressor) of toxin-antitoxin stability system
MTIDKVASGSYFSSMRAVGLKVLKNRLSEYVRLASGGETVLVTDRDRVVAELVPPRAGRGSELADSLLADAVRKGWITPPTLPTDAPPARKPVCSWAELQSELALDREDR